MFNVLPWYYILINIKNMSGDSFSLVVRLRTYSLNYSLIQSCDSLSLSLSLSGVYCLPSSWCGSLGINESMPLDSTAHGTLKLRAPQFEKYLGGLGVSHGCAHS